MFRKNYFKVLLFSSKPNFPRQFSQEYTPKALRSLKAKSTRNTVQFYVDSHRVRAVAGNGGDGCISFLSAWCKEYAGPDGGDGGHGGHIIFQATHSVKSLNHCHSVIQAKNGERGFNKNCDGKNASHVTIPVPLGTIIKDATGRVVGDLSTEGMMFVAARGGAGGRGNKFFLTDTEQAPDVAEFGAIGETNVYSLEVRSMAHIGLIGFPNAGKSTLLRALTRARPNVAPYPFTTLRPHIGMIPYDDYEQVAIADLPGLIPGSHKNFGLGIQFLQHVERCRGLIYLLDGSNNPLEQYEFLTYELHQYSNSLSTRPNLIVVNKIDLKEGLQGLDEVRNGIHELVVRGDEVGTIGDEVGTVGDEVSTVGDEVGTFGDEVGTVGDEVGTVGNDKGLDMIASKDIVQANQTVKINSEKDVKIIGVSAKTGLNLSNLLKLLRNMYDAGDTRKA